MLCDQNAALQAQVQAQTMSSVPPTFASTVCAPKLAVPEKFNGDRAKFCGFLNQCHLQSLLQPLSYTRAQAQVGLMLSLLIGEALK